MNEQQLAAVKQALEALESERDKYLEWGDEDGAPEDVYEAITALQSIISQDALDKMADNARELGLSYDDAIKGGVGIMLGGKRIDPASIYAEPKIGCVNHDCDQCKAVQEPVAMRMPKVGDRVVCIEDESLGTVVYLTAGGSPEIKFDDGSHGTYMLREFAELFGYTTPLATPVQEPVARYCCHFCFKVSGGVMLDRMILCPECGNKRCPKASDHNFSCTGSNEPGQWGSIYTTPPAAQKPWVGLTDEDLEDIAVAASKGNLYDLRIAIEAKLKKKNT